MKKKHTNGKGDSRRPGDEEAYRSNWDSIFGSKATTEATTEATSKATVLDAARALLRYEQHGYDGVTGDYPDWEMFFEALRYAVDNNPTGSSVRMLTAARALLDYSSKGAPEHLFWDDYYNELERAVDAEDREANYRELKKTP